MSLTSVGKQLNTFLQKFRFNGKYSENPVRKVYFTAERTMKKFLYEYKAFRSKSDTEKSKNGNYPDTGGEEMGVFKWLRRERVTVTTQHLSPVHSSEERHSQSLTQIGTIRTDEYKRDLAEFQARRSTGGANDNDADYKKDLLEFQQRRTAQKEEEYQRNLAEFQARRSKDDYKRDLEEFKLRRSFDKEARVLPDTPVKKRCGRHSLPVSCTDCTAGKDHDNTFNYEKKSATKYKKKYQRREKSESPEDRNHMGNIQFLFQNQVFMPGNIFPSSYSEPQKSKRTRKSCISPDFVVQRHIDFKDNVHVSPPLFYKDNSLPYDSKQFLNSKGCDETDGATEKDNASGSSSDCVRHDSTTEKLWEVMNELKHLDQWADEQLQNGDDYKSETSAYGLPVASASDLDVASDGNRTWNRGTWGVVPVQVKMMTNVSIEKNGKCQEVDILRKCRHPNIILLMGLYQDIHGNVHMICEECIDSLYSIIHIQGRILSAQTSVHYALDVANALAFLRMHGYVHTGVTSHAVMVNTHDVAKLVDVSTCVKLTKIKPLPPKQYDDYSPEPQYVNIEDTHETTTIESEPLISRHPSETYITNNAVTKEYKLYRDSENYRWHAPELFVPDEMDTVHPCAKSDVYSLCLVLWECCNAAVPWKTLTYEKLHELYTLWKTGIRLPQDGTYPGSLLDLLQRGLKIDRAERIDLDELQNTLKHVKRNLDELEYVVIPARLPKKKSTFSITGWETTDESECQSPVAKNIQHKVIVHCKESSSGSEKDTKSDSIDIDSPRYETINKQNFHATFSLAEKCYIPDEENENQDPFKYPLVENDYSTACSTPISVFKAKIKDITPHMLQRSDSTEYCSIMSPQSRNITLNNTNVESADKSTAKLSRSFTPKSYKPLHIKVPQCNLDSVKSILKDQSGSEKSSYKFDITNYSLPATPIARSNKLRKNAWLSGDLARKSCEKVGGLIPENEENKAQSAPETPATSNRFFDKQVSEENCISKPAFGNEDQYSESNELNRNSFTGLRRTPIRSHPADFSPEAKTTNPWSLKSPTESPNPRTKLEDALANVNVKPLVAIHEKWIYEANKKTGRFMSVPGDSRACQVQAVKPASHCVDTARSSLPPLNLKRPPSRSFRTHPVSPSASIKNGVRIHTLTGINWEQFCQARDAVAKNISFSPRDDKSQTKARSDSKGTGTDDTFRAHKIDRSTDTQSIEEFICDLIRREFQHLFHEISDDGSKCTNPKKNDEILAQKVAHIVQSLKNGEEQEDESPKKDLLRSFSRLKINGNNKPLLQITFNRTGENSLQVLDNCVNVTICDSPIVKEKMNISLEDTLVEDSPLKRCQAFNAIQDARSTEDLYIDDDLSTQMEENFGGKVQLIPLHGSLHEILCEREDECCLIKVKQENGCDSIYFKCDNSDTESRDAIDGCFNNTSQDTVVYKRSISVVEERIQRISPKDNRKTPVRTITEKTIKIRPKSEVYVPKITEKTRAISTSSPSLSTQNLSFDEVEVNLENTMCYQDSSSDECLRCQVENQVDEFELLEKSIEEDMAIGNKHTADSISFARGCLAESISPQPISGCLSKISEENLSSIIEEPLGDFKSSRETI